MSSGGMEIEEEGEASGQDNDHHPPTKVPSLKGRKNSATMKIVHPSDLLDLESNRLVDENSRNNNNAKWSAVLFLAFQSIGVVYGDLGTSPLYVFSSTFANGIKHNDDVLGVLALILYTLTLLPLVKYVFIVLRATDNGDGGTFALYSLICRYTKVGLIPNRQAVDEDVSNFQLQVPKRRLDRSNKIKTFLENSHFAKLFLLMATLLGTSMVVGDGVLTPVVSVTSAVSGIKSAASTLGDEAVVWISIVILILLFIFQSCGADKVGLSFAPVLSLWFILISGIGLYNFIMFDSTVLKALYPKYIIEYFRRNGKDAWISLGGVVLSTTGTEALFADVGLFSVRAIQISTCAVVYPSLLIAYTGQASYLRMHNDAGPAAFYRAIPGAIYWPMFVVAVMAAIIASQAMISGTFTIIQQSLSLGCFPHVKVVHTSAKHKGQIYIPEINYLLMILCVALTLGFRDYSKINNAYGLAVVFVMTLTSAFLVLIMVMIWKTNILLVVAYLVVIGSVELAYLSSVLYKFDQGGYLPICLALILMIIMFIWNDVYRRKYHYELEHMISPDNFKQLTVETANLKRVPGLAVFYSELVHGIPPIFRQYLMNLPVLHSVLVFVSIKYLPISKVPLEERFLFCHVEPRELNVYRCVVRYGYTDSKEKDEESLEKLLVERLKDFVKMNYIVPENGAKEIDKAELQRAEVEVVERAVEAGVVHMVGESEVVASKGGPWYKRIVINHLYSFLKRNLRQSDKGLDIPQKQMLKVGMIYELS